MNYLPYWTDSFFLQFHWVQIWKCRFLCCSLRRQYPNEQNYCPHLLNQGEESRPNHPQNQKCRIHLQEYQFFQLGILLSLRQNPFLPRDPSHVLQKSPFLPSFCPSLCFCSVSVSPMNVQQPKKLLSTFTKLYKTSRSSKICFWN